LKISIVYKRFPITENFKLGSNSVHLLAPHTFEWRVLRQFWFW